MEIETQLGNFKRRSKRTRWTVFIYISRINHVQRKARRKEKTQRRKRLLTGGKNSLSVVLILRGNLSLIYGSQSLLLIPAQHRSTTLPLRPLTQDLQQILSTGSWKDVSIQTSSSASSLIMSTVKLKSLLENLNLQPRIISSTDNSLSISSPYSPLVLYWIPERVPNFSDLQEFHVS